MKENLIALKQKLQLELYKLKSLPRYQFQRPENQVKLHHLKQQIKVLSYDIHKASRNHSHRKIVGLSLLGVFLFSFTLLFIHSPPTLTGSVIGPTNYYEILAAPTHNTPILNSSSGKNISGDDLTVYNISTTDTDGDGTKNIYSWYTSNISFHLANLPFEGAANTTRDYTNFSNNASIHDAYWNGTGGFDGRGAFKCDGTDDYLKVHLDGTTGKNITVMFWAKPTLTVAAGGVFMWGDALSTGTPYLVFDRNTATAARWYVDGSYRIDNQTINDATWYHFAATYNGSAWLFYTNGSLMGFQGNAGQTYQSNALAVFLCNDYNGYYSGVVDDVNIFNRSLSGSQIFNYYSNRTNVFDAADTFPGEQWKACVTPNDNTTDGEEKCSNNLTILSNRAPTHNPPILNSTFGKNSSRYENITVYNISTTDADGDPTKNIITWYTNNISFHTLNLPLEGETSSLRDFTNFSNNATNNGAVWNATGGFDGRGAYRCDGTNNYLEVPLRGDSGNNLTVMFWAKPIGGSTGVGMFQWASTLNDGAPYILLQRDSSTSARWYTSGSYRFTNLTINDNTWYHFALTHNGSAWLHYVNGTLGGFSASAITGQSAAVSLYLCNGYFGYFGGMFDDVNVFNRSLSANQILNYYSNRTNVFDPADTFAGEQWKACVTPNDNTTYGEDKCSNNITIFGNRAPSPGTIILNSTLGTNGDAENLTVYNTSSSDPDGDPYRSIITWYGQNIPYQILNLPFETYINNTRTRDYVNLSNNGSVEGANGGEPRWKETEGFNGKGAYECDGTDDYILSNLPGTTGINVTISFWTKPTTDGTGVGAFAWQDSLTSGAPYILFQRNDATNFRLYVDNGYRISNLTTALGVWHHYAINYNGSAWLAYVNGTLAGFYTGGQGSQANALGLYLCNGWSGYYPGFVDDLKVYNRSLSSEQILNLYRGRDDILDANETKLDDKWTACITASDTELESTDTCSNTITIASASNSAPTVTNLSMFPNVIFENDTITTSTLYTDAESDSGTVRFMWYRNGTSIFNQTNTSIATGTNVTATLSTGNFSHFDNINVTVIADDGSGNSSQQNSSTTQISNSVPTMPILGTPISTNTTVSRTPWFRWNNITDTDNDNITYNLLIDDNSAFNNPEVNVSGIQEMLPNTSYNVSTELNVDTTYFWRLRAYDNFNYSNYSATFNFTINSYLAISIIQAEVNFSIMEPGQRKNTTLGNPPPFRVESAGNIIGNITIISDSFQFLMVNRSSSHFQFAVRENETNAFNTTASATTWTNFTLGSVLAHVVDFDWHDWKDDFLLDILVEVPYNETLGPKNSTVIFSISSQ